MLFDLAYLWLVFAVCLGGNIRAIYDCSVLLLTSNRAAAFLNLVKLSKALADAETTISLNPQWEKVISGFAVSPKLYSSVPFLSFIVTIVVLMDL